MSNREALEVLQFYHKFCEEKGCTLTQVDQALCVAIEVLEEVLGDGTTERKTGIGH